MSHKPLLDGNKAKFIFGELADAATRVVNSAADALMAEHKGDEEAVTAAITQIFKDSMTVQRIATLLESGRADEAEALILRGSKTNE